MVDRRPGGAQRIPRPDGWRAGEPAPWDPLLRPDERPTVRQIVGQLPQRGSSEAELGFDGARSSAVLVLLHDGPDGVELLFTRRPMHMRNHRGEMSFPGGRTEEGETPEQTALREAWEEVGLEPALVSVHGELDHISTYVSRSYIVPVVGSVSARPQLTPHAPEVDRILWVSLADLVQPGTFREEWWPVADGERNIFFFELDDETVWGATARMVHQLLRLAHRVDEPEPPIS